MRFEYPKTQESLKSTRDCMPPKHTMAMMRRTKYPLSKVHYACAVFACALLGTHVWAAKGTGGMPTPDPQSLLARDNLIAWEVETGEKIRGPEERAQMLKRLGFRRYAHKTEPGDVNQAYVDGQIEALQRNDIEMVAWWFDIDNP